MDNVKEIGRFSDKLNHSRLNQEEIEIMNNAITMTIAGSTNNHLV